MPPRYAYWTIILDGKPTAFRARTQDELLPTLRQLQSRHPDAVMRWFSRGRLWQSPDEERLARTARKATRESRGRDWRPGGSHEDPRARFKIPREEKRRRFRDRLHRDRNEPRSDAGAPPREEGGRSPSEKKRPWTPREGERPWKPKRPPGHGERDRGWKPERPGGRRPGSDRGWKPGGPKGGTGRGGGGRRGGGGGGRSR